MSTGVEREVLSVTDEGREGDYRTLTVQTRRGPVMARLYQVAGADAGVVFVGGVGGGFDTPAKGLYPRLAQDLASHEGIAALQVRLRYPTVLDEAVYDIRAGVSALIARGIERVGLVGHSLGGAAVIQVGALESRVATVVTLATQSYGTESVRQLAPRPLLLVHGDEDHVLPLTSSEYVWRRAGPHADFVPLEGVGHVMDEAADTVYHLLRGWLTSHVAQSRRGAGRG